MYPLSLTLAGLASAYWHIKTIQIDVDYTWTDSADYTLTGSVQLPLNNQSYTGAGSIVNENSLACGRYTKYEAIAGLVATKDGLPETVEWNRFALFWDEDNGAKRWKTVEDGFYSPSMLLTIDVGDSITLIIPDFDFTPDSFANGEYFGQPFVIDVIGHGSPIAVLGSFAITAPPTAGYWPYNSNGTGAPLFNANTGEILGPNVVD